MMPRISTTAAVALLLAMVACSEPTGPQLEEAAELATASAELVECPTSTTRSVSDLIGPLGGVLELDGHKVTVPVGALALPTTLKLTVPASPYVEVDITANGLHNFLFDAPITVQLSYRRCTRTDLTKAQLTAWYIDSRTKALLEHMGGVDDKVQRTVTFTTPHLSGYAIAD